jgi:hypothetical protein
MIMLDSSSSKNQDYGMQNNDSYDNPTPAVKKSSPKKEEEISIEDIPF